MPRVRFLLWHLPRTSAKSFGFRMFLVCQVVLLLNFTASQGLPTLTLINATSPFVFKANTTSEIYFAVEDVSRSDFLTYNIFINYQHPGTNVSRLRCYLSRTPQNCTSNNEDCECVSMSGHQYRLKKIFREEDSGNWEIQIAGKGFFDKKTVFITVVSRAQKLIFHSSNFVFEANTASKVCFSFKDDEKDSLTYTVLIDHRIPGTNISRLQCAVLKTPEGCSSNSEACQCPNIKAGHDYRLKKVFQEEDSGEWIFSVLGNGLSAQKAITITVLSGEQNKSRATGLYSITRIPNRLADCSAREKMCLCIYGKSTRV